MRSANVWLVCVWVCAVAGCARAAGDVGPNAVAGEPFAITDDGGWCWFEDPRAVVHDGAVIVGTVAMGTTDQRRRGNVEVHSYDLATGHTRAAVLHAKFQADDHNSPALLVRPDGRLLASYAKHGNERFHHIRVGEKPGDIASWRKGATTPLKKGGVTYSNLYRMSASGLVYNFFRGTDINPFFLYSSDEGDTFKLGGRVLAQRGRPYMRYASDGVDTVHFAATDAHPRDFDNSVYHGYIKIETVNGKTVERLYDSHGKLLDGNLRDGNAVGPAKLTRVYQGGPGRVGWTSSIELDEAGHPYMGYTVQVGGHGLSRGKGGEDHRFHYARFDGGQWHRYEIAHAGSRLYAGEDDYTGLIEVDPGDKDVVYISTDADPVTGEPLVSKADGLRHRELFRGRTRDGGRTWAWEPITWNSTVDNVRPIVLRADGSRTVVLWLRGKMTTYTNYDFKVVGLVVGEALPALATAADPAVTPPYEKFSNALDLAAIEKVADAVARWQMTHESRHGNDGWHEGAFYAGYLWWAQQSGNDRFYDWMKQRSAAMGWKLAKRVRHADDHCVGYAYGELYRRDRDPVMLAPMRAQFDELAKLPYDESLEWGNHIHNREWAWCDALFMAPPTLFQLTRLTGDPKYAAQSDRLWWKTTDYLYDTEEHLYFRDSRFFKQREVNGKKVFWSRGNGWVYAGLPRLIESLHAGHPSKERYIKLFKEMSVKVASLQKPDGYWPSSLLHAEGQPHPETSGTAFFTYGLAWGINNGLLDEATYRPVVEKAWKALVDAVHPGGKLGWVQRVAAAPGSTGYDETEVYAVGGFLLAASQVHQMLMLDGGESVAIGCRNGSDVNRLGEVVEIDWARVRKALPGVTGKNVAVRDGQGGRFVPTQALDEDGDGDIDKLLFTVDLLPKEARPYRVVKLAGAQPKAMPKRTMARFVPERRDDFAWENDRIAYRMYGPGLAPDKVGSGVDVWVKSVRYPVMNKFYKHGDYHKDHGEGLDGYGVGPTRGAGGSAFLVNDKFVAPYLYDKWKLISDGPLRTVFELGYKPLRVGGATLTETKRVSLDLGENLNRFDVRYKIDGDVAMARVATGIAARKGGSSHTDEANRLWIHFEPVMKGNGRTWVAMVWPGGVKAEAVERDGHVWLVARDGVGDSFSYYAGAGWSKGIDFKTANDWSRYVYDFAERLDSPVRITFKE